MIDKREEFGEVCLIPEKQNKKGRIQWEELGYSTL